MKLTEAHIAQLFNFTQQHFVDHYDVQCELVDHLANDIEQIWETQPNLSFEQARDKSFKKFGVFGFMDVINAKGKQMNKQYTKLIWRFSKDWFTLPKVAVTLTLLCAIFFALKTEGSKYLLLGILLGISVLDLIIQLRTKKKKPKEKHLFLLEDIIQRTRISYTGLTFINLFNFVNLTHINFNTLENTWLLLISILTTLLILLFYVIIFVIPKKAQELLQETYPQYKWVKNS